MDRALRKVYINKALVLIKQGKTISEISKQLDCPVHIFTGAFYSPAAAYHSAWMQARREAAYTMADELLRLSDAPMQDGTAVRQAQLQIETRRWLLERLLPDEFGSKVTLNHTITPAPARDNLQRLTTDEIEQLLRLKEKAGLIEQEEPEDADFFDLD